MHNDDEKLIRSFERTLRALNRTSTTIESYTRTLRALSARYPDVRLPDVSREHITSYLDEQVQQVAAATAAQRFRNLRRFYGWAMDEEIITRSPMWKMRSPAVPESLVKVFSDDDIGRMLKATNKRGIIGRRDHAIVRVFLDTGVRLSELAGLTVEDIDLVHDTVTVLGKGRRVRVVPFGSKTGTAIDRYLRLRQQSPHSALRFLWVGKQGRLTMSGVAQMLTRLEQTSGVAGINPHRFRHTFAHHWKRAGGGDDDLMRLTGWRSRDMLARYGASAADERARQSHKRLGLADRF